MNTKVYSLFDSKAECYGTPFFMPNRAMAIRAFGNLASDRDTLVAKHPTDFTLFEIGSFDDHTGVVLSVTPVSLGHAVSYCGKGPVNVTPVERRQRDVVPPVDRRVNGLPEPKAHESHC